MSDDFYYGMFGPQDLDNLNEAVIPNADGPNRPIRENHKPVRVEAASVEVFFDNIEARLVAEINRWPVVVGRMARLTSEPVLRALATRQDVSVLVQKEDFLRPDVGGWSKERLRALYAAMPGFDRNSADSGYNFASDPSSLSIRCVGRMAERDRIPPRMHHKFIVFCTIQKTFHPAHEDFGIEWAEGWSPTYQPVAVWTGSYNASSNATRSLENAVLIRNPEVARAYFVEWLALLGISEPLNWQHEHVYPEFRLGT